MKFRFPKTTVTEKSLVCFLFFSKKCTFLIFLSIFIGLVEVRVLDSVSIWAGTIKGVLSVWKA